MTFMVLDWHPDFSVNFHLEGKTVVCACMRLCVCVPGTCARIHALVYAVNLSTLPLTKDEIDLSSKVKTVLDFNPFIRIYMERKARRREEAAKKGRRGREEEGRVGWQ